MISFASLDMRPRRLPDPAHLAIGLAIIAAFTVFKLTAGQGVPMVDFFLIPVAGVGWLARSHLYSYLAAIIAAVVSVILAQGAATPAALGPTVTSGVARLVLYLVVLSFLSAMRRMQIEREWQASSDPLTGVTNAGAFRLLAAAEIERGQRYAYEISLAYLDIDDFKAVNDIFGHEEGDHVLLQVSHVLRTAVRSVDSIARLGGDEFVVFMPETSPSQARAVAERLQQGLVRLRTEAGGPITCSIGLVTFAGPPVSLQELISAADELMYRVKRNGKDHLEQARRVGSGAVQVPRRAARIRAAKSAS